MKRKIRLAFVSSHPIQYHAPWFRVLSDDPSTDLEVLYCHSPTPVEQGDAGFGVAFSWDVPLLGGYKHRFLENVSKRPALGTFGGLDTPELWTSINRHRYDAVVVNGWHYKSAWQAIRACWRSGVPVLVRSDSHLHTPRHPLKRAAKSAAYRWFVPRLDGCLPVGRWSAEYFARYGARPERVFIVPHAIDPVFTARARDLAPQRAELRATWTWKPEQVVFLFAGKFITKKRPMDFVAAMKLASRGNPRVCGLMVGDGPLRADCEREAAQSDVPIRFAGFMNQSTIACAYVAADFLVVPSDAETWGLVVNEAMTCGTPCLVSDQVGCGPDLIVPGRTGDTFPLGNIAAMSKQILDHASQQDKIAAMAADARAAIEKHSVAAAAERLCHAVTAVLRLA
jgi:glycosyltransferase involved in cell wall biosynthesis